MQRVLLYFFSLSTATVIGTGEDGALEVCSACGGGGVCLLIVRFLLLFVGQ